MADVDWPLGLPQNIEINGYHGSGPQNAAIRTVMESGRAKQRPRFTNASRPVTGKITVTSAQLKIFIEFHKTTLGMGALAFNWFDPEDAPGAARTPTELQLDVSQLGSGYDYVPAQNEPGLFTLTMALDLLP